jgi:hypothetical protein
VPAAVLPGPLIFVPVFIRHNSLACIAHPSSKCRLEFRLEDRTSHRGKQ